MLGLMFCVLIGVLPKNGIRAIVISLFFIVQYSLLNFSLAIPVLIDREKIFLAWIIMMIPSVSFGIVVWWTVNHWLILVGYLYNIAFISLFIWLWTIINRKVTY